MYNQLVEVQGRKDADNNIDKITSITVALSEPLVPIEVFLCTIHCDLEVYYE